MPEQFIKLANNFYVSPQITAEDVNVAKRMGVELIICNRPDGEEPNQPLKADIANAAQDLGIKFAFIPIDGRGVTRLHIEDFQKATKGNEGPVLAYCRSGTRSTMLRAFSRAVNGDIIAEIIGEASEAGYDLYTIAPSLEAVLPERRKKPRN